MPNPRKSRTRLFLSQFLRNPRSIGAIAPSSQRLAQLMLDPVDFANAAVVVEFGPGTGAITSEIARRLRPGQKYLGFEINQAFHAMLVAQYPALEFIHASGATLPQALQARSLPQADAIICGLPWATLPLAVQADIMQGVLQSLRSGGVFITFGYLQGLLLPGAGALRRKLKAGFSQLRTTKIAWRNIPPAFAYVCTR